MSELLIVIYEKVSKSVKNRQKMRELDDSETNLNSARHKKVFEL